MNLSAPPASALLASLREIARALSAAWDLDTTLDLIARKTTAVMSVDSCSIYLLEGDTLWLRASTGLAVKAVGRGALKMGEGLTGWAAQHNTPVAEREAQADPRFKFVPYSNERPFHSLAAAPLVNRGRVIGAMNVQTFEPHTFTPDQLELLQLISDLAAGALERASLYDSMHRQIHELTTLAKVSETVTSPIYLDDMLALLVEMAAKVMDTPVCSLRLLDAASGMLVTRSARSDHPRYRPRPPLKMGEGVSGLVARDRKPMTVSDVRTDARYPFNALAQEEGLVSMLSVPLMVREKVIGVLNCYTTEPRAFTDADISLFSTLANQTALAIENAELVTNAAIVREMHHRIKNNLQTVAMLLQMQAHASTGLSTAEVLHTSVNRIQSIAAVHEALAQEGLRHVDVKDVIRRIAHSTAQNLLRPDLEAEILVDGDAALLPSRPATALALVINELLQNALEHAFVGRARGAVHIHIGRRPKGYRVTVSDDGVGLPETKPASLGLEIVETLVRDDLRGQLSFKSTARGTIAAVTIPKWEDEA